MPCCSLTIGHEWLDGKSTELQEFGIHQSFKRRGIVAFSWVMVPS